MIRLIRHYDRKFIRENPEALFIFGDNMRRTGQGKGAGQATAARGEPNAVGVVTKHAPSMAYSAFFTEKDFEEVRPVIDEAFDRVEKYLQDGGLVYWPEYGVGTGRALLQETAPSIFDYIKMRFSILWEQYGEE